MISNELLEEVIYLSLKGKFVTKDLITKIILDVVSKNDPITKKLLNNIDFCKTENPFATALCSVETGNIIIDLIKIKNYEIEQNRTSMMCCNLEILQIILHEIKHLQSKYILSLNNFESKLINISSYEYIYNSCYKNAMKKSKNIIELNKLVKKMYYEFTYNFFELIPDERLAELGSFEILLDSIEKYNNFKNDYLNEYLFLINEYKRALASGYEYRKKSGNYASTLIKYLIEIKRLDLLSYLGLKLKVSDTNKLNMSITDKMKYGLPISNEEYKSLDKILIKK